MTEARTPPESVDLLVVGAAELATPQGTAALGGATFGALRVIPRGAVAIRGERIVGVGEEAELRRAFRAERELDADGGTIVPGFVDAHTHPVFAGTREEEFELRTAGATYVEIAERGGGIVSSMRGVRGASAGELLSGLLVRLGRFLESGTTTVEAKSGYGLSLADELKCLEVIAEANRLQPVRLVPTFLGAHSYPPEFQGNHAAYVDLLVEEMIPAIASSGLAEYCDVFTEAHAFGLEESRRILTRARESGLRLRLHADQLTGLGGAELAAELGATSADHLEFVGERGIAALAAAGVVPVLCPLVPLYLRVDREAPARRMVAAGLTPALATDFNPGSCYTQSMPEVFTWAALRLGFSVGECLVAGTLNAAASLDRATELGSIEVGKRADLVVLDHPSHRLLCYEFGRNPVSAVVAGGRIVHRARPSSGPARSGRDPGG